MNKMAKGFLQKSVNVLLARQTNILSAAVVIMVTVIFSQFLGLIRQRLLVAIFGASNTLGVYLAAAKFPDLLFQLIIAGALSSAFIPVYVDFVSRGKTEDAKRLAATLLSLGLVIFSMFSVVLFIFAPFFLSLLNPGAGFTPEQMSLMANLTRIIVISQMLFIIGTFFSAVLQSHNHFFAPGLAAALYNLGIIIGIVIFAPLFGIYAACLGMIIGGIFFISLQLPFITRVGFSFRPHFSLKTAGVSLVTGLMWPRTLSLAVFQLGTLATVVLVSYLKSSGRNYVIFDYAQTLAFAPVALFGQAIAQAAFPVLSREKENMNQFKVTFLTSFMQLLYLVMPISAMLLVLRIPVVRLVFGAGQFDWNATVLTGKVLSILAISIFAQALISLVSRAFYALHDAKTPLLIGSVSTIIMIIFGFIGVAYYKFGIESIAIAYSINNIFNLLISMIYLNKKTGGFAKQQLFIPVIKIFTATLLSGIVLYVPIKLLDQLVFDTTYTINLLILTSISSLAGLSLYVFLTWLFNVKEAMTFLLLFKKLGNWQDVLHKSAEPIDATHFNQ